MFSRFFRSLCLDAAADAAAAASAGQARPATPPVTTEVRVSALTTQLIAQHGTVENALRHLVLQSAATDAELATLRAQVADYRAKLPEGSVVLSKAEAESLVKLKALGTVDEIVAGMKERDTLKAEVSTTAAKALYRSVAKAGGVDEEAFEVHGMREKLTAELRDVTTVENGKSVTKKMPFVRKGDDKAVFQSLADYTATLPAHEQRALKPVPPTTGTPSPTGTQYVEQSATPTGGEDTSVAAAAATALLSSTLASLPPGLLPATR